MSKFVLFLSLAVIYVSCCALEASADPSAPGPSSIASAPKNVRILSPAAYKLYKMLRRGQLDDDDIFTEDENYFRKRQYDDYGHMRFGKRGAPGKDFDDYGHMRFGR